MIFPRIFLQSIPQSDRQEKVNNDPPFIGLSFETSVTEDAILTLPKGATAYDLENIPRMRAYASANIESWYRYINGPRGREANNGEVRLVIGCDKSTSWGMAVVSSQNRHKVHHLRYRSFNDHNTPSPPIPLYKWEYSGYVEARVGLDLEEIEKLKREDDSEAAVQGKYPNQCLFFRTLNLMLNDEVFTTISQELELALMRESQHQYPAFPSHSSSGTNASQSNDAGRQQSPNLNVGTQRALTLELPRPAMEQRVTTSISLSAHKLHPSDDLNRRILKKTTKSRVVITQDEDWCSVINEDDEIMPDPSEITERVLAAYGIKEENGRRLNIQLTPF